MKMEQSVPKRRHIKFRRQGIIQQKAYNIQNRVKVWNQETIKFNFAIKANISFAISQVRVSTQTHTTLVLSIYSRLHVSAINVSHHQWEPKHVVFDWFSTYTCDFWHLKILSKSFHFTNGCTIYLFSKKVKQSRYRPGVAQRFPGI
jgi:hypothetical protein